MSDGGRMVYMTAEQHADIERYIEQEMRAFHNERAARMMTLSLAYRFASDPLPDNVVELDVHSRKVGA